MSRDVVLNISCALKSFHCRRRFATAQWTLGDFRLYIEQLLDISIENLIIRFRSRELTIDRDNDLLCHVEEFLENDSVTIDSHRRAVDIDDVNRLPEKYRMPDEVYARRKGTLKEYLQRHKLGRYGNAPPSLSACDMGKDRLTLELRESNRAKLQRLQIGMTVAVNEPTMKRRCGEVVYIGILRGIRDEFVGVLFDGPVGDSNGCDGIVRYFDAKRKHASFVRLEHIEMIPEEFIH